MRRNKSKITAEQSRVESKLGPTLWNTPPTIQPSMTNSVPLFWGWSELLESWGGVSGEGSGRCGALRGLMGALVRRLLHRTHFVERARWSYSALLRFAINWGRARSSVWQQTDMVVRPAALISRERGRAQGGRGGWYNRAGQWRH